MDRLLRWFTLVFLTCALMAAATLAFPAANLWFVIGVFAHVGLGLLLIPFALVIWRKRTAAAASGALPKRSNILVASLFGATLAIAAGFGLFLIVRGNTHIHFTERWLHIGFAAAALVFGALWLMQRVPAWRTPIVALSVVMLIVPAGWRTWRAKHLPAADVIRNPAQGYLNMQAESGKNNPFFPAGVQTVLGNNYKHPLLPENFFEDSKTCARCHAQIYNEWKSSMHHNSSFNNQFYRKSIEYMQDFDGSTKQSQWCAGCHDPAVLLTGKWKTPIKNQIHTPAAQAGLGCMACHAIIRVRDTLGNSNFTVQDPPLHQVIESTNPLLRMAHDAALYLNPTPHDKVFLKPFHTDQVGEFCSVCHKVHMDKAVNDYRWSRGFDEYDNWQASGTDWQGARSFYYPPNPMTCADCHMPKVRSNDPAAVNGFIRSHRFAAANTAVPFVNHDWKQLAAEEKFLKGSVTTDIFAIARTQGEQSVTRSNANTPTLSSMFAQGEESGDFGTSVHQQAKGGKVNVMAPLNEVKPTLKPGDNLRVDVVERTLKLGHFFPGGTIDAQEVWVEFKALDGNGKPFFWSGKIRPDGTVDPGAEFYRNVLIDKHGNVITRRNTYAARSVIYVHLIPPGAASVVHYRVQIPKNIKGPVTFIAKLNYRKFSEIYTKFAYAGVLHPGPHALDYDDRPMTYDGSTADVSGKVKKIPNLPVVTISESRVTLPIGKATAVTATEGKTHADTIRWNDYGIGLLLQGDLTGAEQAFQHVTQMEPGYADGWLNVGRVLIQEGEDRKALPWVQKALSLNPKMGRGHYFRAQIEKVFGQYDQALSDLYETANQYPRDRVVLDDIGHILFLKRQYQQAVPWLVRAVEIDPENVEAHYNLMLAYRGLGKSAEANREQKLYLRFKADESATAIAGPYLRTHPDDNNERQPIHEHTSIPLKEMFESGSAASR